MTEWQMALNFLANIIKDYGINMKFKLICEHEPGDVVTHEFSRILLCDVLERTQDFLKGCGFVFDGQLDIIEDEPPPPSYFDRDFAEPDHADFDEDGRC